MGFLDKAKAAAEQAATKAKEGVEDLQTKRELSQAQAELGRVAFDLFESGELEHERLRPVVERIRRIQEKIAAGKENATAEAPDPADPVPADPDPAEESRATQA
jgi:hypothetical protein